jgi:hypothetical protein
MLVSFLDLGIDQCVYCTQRNELNYRANKMWEYHNLFFLLLAALLWLLLRVLAAAVFVPATERR